MSDSEQCSSRLHLDLISVLVSFSYDFLGKIGGSFEKKVQSGGYKFN